MEINAIGYFWKSLGDAMQIEYKGELSRDTWKEVIEFVKDITSWAKEYEVYIPLDEDGARVRFLHGKHHV